MLVLKRTGRRFLIDDDYYYWINVITEDGTECWVYGKYINYNVRSLNQASQ